MYPNLATGALRMPAMSLQALIDLAAKSGFEGIDLSHEQVIAAGGPGAATEMMQKAGLKFGGWGCPVQFRTTDEVFEEGLKTLPERLAVAGQLGAPNCYTYIMPGHDELDYKTNFNLHAERLKRIGEEFARHGVKFALEFVGPQTARAGFKHEFIWNLDQVLELCDAAGPETFNVLLDAWHWYTAEHTAEDITGKLAGRIGYVHVNDGYYGRTVAEQIDNERTLPCETGVIDLKTFCDCLRKVNYEGAITAEPFLNELVRYEPLAVANRTLACIKQMLAL